MIVQLKFRSEAGIVQLGKLGIFDDDESVLAVDVFDLSLQQLRPAEQAGVVQSHYVHRLVGAVGKFHQRASGVDGHRVIDALYASRRVQHVIRHADGVRDRLNRRVHDPHGRAEIDDRRGCAIENSGKQRSHCDHQENREGNAHQQRRKFRLVVDQQFIGEFEDSLHGALLAFFVGVAGSVARRNPDLAGTISSMSGILLLTVTCCSGQPP